LTARGTKTAPNWLSYLDLACAALAGALWYAFPLAGPWPLVLALLPWGLRLALTGRLTYTAAFDLPLALFLLLAGLAVWTAYDRPVAGAKFWLIVGAVLLYYALLNARALGQRLAWLLGLFGAAVAVYFLMTHDWSAMPAKIEALTRLGQRLQAPLPTLPGHRLHPNVAGGIMAAMMPYAAVATILGWWPRPGRRAAGRWLSLLLGLGLCAIVAFGLLMTTSRGAWLALAGALVLAAAGGVAAALSRGLGRRRPALQRWVLPGLVVGLLVLALVFALAWPGGIWGVVSALPGPNTGPGRLDLLRNSLVLVHDYAFLGAGLDGFTMLYSTYALLIHVGHSPHSHNLFFNVAIEQGLPSVLLLGIMWLIFGLALWRGLGRPLSGQDSEPRRGRPAAGWPAAGLLAAAGLSLAITLAHGLVDDVYYGSRGVLLLFVPLAFAAPYLAAPAGARNEGESRRWLMALPAGLGLAMLLALVWRGPLLSLVFSNLGAVHQSQAELSVYEWPAWPIQDALRRELDLGQPVAEFERALALDPNNASANRRLGQIELSLGEYEDALRHLEAAYAAEPWSPTTQLMYGEALIVNGRLDEGQAQWAALSPGEGQFQVRAFWYRHIGDDQRADWIEQAAGAP
jgi:O-antigen ligase